MDDDYNKNNKDIPPVDDVCPICFDYFTLPCRSNCANCIMQFWTYRSSIQPCKCPMCCCLIIDLKPQSIQPPYPYPYPVDEVLQKVQHYNRLYVNGVLHQGMYLQQRVSRFLIDPDGLRCIYYVMRLLGLLLALLYENWEFEFIPTDGCSSFVQGAYIYMAAKIYSLCLYIYKLACRLTMVQNFHSSCCSL
ncbi:hypothetical protein ACJIZ3_015766 [Penstemon smallii]|uniref:RING-type domain-containing protein n=1 Tax=Penstemon smallii TaxID=265156 RepID=A0ABD3RNN9_9LAMI